jgi:CheY-like chemotaxis protein|tara:strand:+ start:630 stop:998 length:369 start_codon:yes stop_codon:yes gene_type:complete
MAIPLLICDDSAMSRKMVKRSLPPEWDVEVTMAGNGIEGLEAIRSGKGEVVFLDLTMPELDGYGVLESIKTESLKCLVIVISADIQPEAQERVLGLGALAFIKKPINSDKLKTTLKEYGLLD